MADINRRKTQWGGMLTETIERLIELTPSGLTVLDVGGGGCPFNRADWIIDIQDYEKRASGGSYGPEIEHFTEKSWIRQDICSGEWPFEDKAIDFAVCAHTLEDIRDPLPVCRELNRVAKAGYIECPSRLVESFMDLVRVRVIGYGNHKWFVEMKDDHPDGRPRVWFTPKSHLIYCSPEFFLPHYLLRQIPPKDMVVGLFWEDSFNYNITTMVHDDDVMDNLANFAINQKRRFGEI